MGLSIYIGLCCLGILITNPFLGAKAASCPRDWLQKQGNCYGYFDQGLTWDAAELECQSYGPGCHLASILSPQESSLVSTYIKDKQGSTKHVWMGLRDISGAGPLLPDSIITKVHCKRPSTSTLKKRRWRWADESTFNYRAWVAQQPDNHRQMEHCGELTNYSDFKLWNDNVCSNLNAYICKYQL
ncbi:C-type lectin BpLec-like isoform X1 [Ahaetulla prasina]|uniref:C-type lectin BpLec-like isoform X1 n=1 Tax=Ahaetulla prasina TaxID=499056 RepID=UPI002648C248|nr:C-type lectin BpLec-like isoform X1 [Ahaetulla prasina]